MNNINAFSNAIRMQARLASNIDASERHGEISAYDPEKYCVKVRLMPEDFETGWIQMPSLFVGSKYGLYFGPELKQQVTVSAVNGSKDNYKITGFYYNDVENPIDGDEKVPSGQVLIQDKSGTLFRFKPDDGELDITSSKDTVQSVGQDLKITVEGDATILVKGDATEEVDGDVTRTIKGNLDETIQGNVTRTISGTLTETVTGAASQTYSAGLTQNITGGFTSTASTYQFTGPCTWNGIMSVYAITTTGTGGYGTSTFNGSIHATQTIQSDTNVTAGSDVTGGGISLDTHTHSGVVTGSASTGAPH